MKEIVISAEDEKVDMIIENIRNLGMEVKAVDEVISFDEAKRRVSEAVEEYRSGKMKLIDDEDFWDDKEIEMTGKIGFVSTSFEED
jgi:FtsZ-binding cell division protein ZapB